MMDGRPTGAASSHASTERTIWRFRLFVCCLSLTALAFVQRPGMVVSDTKLDLTADPGGLLARALHMWDPESAFGQVQNQAYGYLFPMGPFHLVGAWIDLPGWAVQRCWLAVILVVAFLGIVKLAELLRLGSPLTRAIAGFAFALSPRMLTTLGPISIEAWPSAVAPWVLIPLVIGSTRGSPRKAAVMSAAAIALVGGVNAAATAAVLPLAALWLLTRTPGPRRHSMMVWWPIFTLLGTLWWLVPLFLLGRYSPPFMDFIESSAVTTFPTTLFDTLRGTSDWVAYIDSGWVAGNDLVTTNFLILNVATVVALGVVGIGLRDNPHRQFLGLSLLIGMIMVTAGHVGHVDGWFAGELRTWLDGALAPLRNVHKFDVVIRVPLVLGLAHLLGSATNISPARERSAIKVGLTVLALIAVVGASVPALQGRLTPDGEFKELPGYWAQTADWLAKHDNGTRSLLLPGSKFGSYVWGEPSDEPMQALAETPWAVRNAVPLAPPGNIRMLSAVEARLATGEGSTGLSSYLRRAGVGHLVVRNDLKRSDDVPDPVLVHQALVDSPGIERVASFGPPVGGDARLDDDRPGPRVVVNQGWQQVYPAVEVFEVSGGSPASVASDPVVVAGGPETLLELSDLGVIGDAPAILAVDAPRDIGNASVILTDGLRRKSAAFGRVHDNMSQTLSLQDNRHIGPAREYELGNDDRWTTHARLEGVGGITASSSTSDTDTLGRVQPEQAPFSALDGDPETTWVSGWDNGARGPWWEVTFDEPVTVSTLDITMGDEAGREERSLIVSTSHERVVTDSAAPGQVLSVSLGSQLTRTVRVGLTQGAASYGARLALAEVIIPGADPRRPLVLPRIPRSWGAPDQIVIAADHGYTSGCVAIAGETRCAPGRSSLGEDGNSLDRVVPMSYSRPYETDIAAVPRPGLDLEALIQKDQPINASVSSQSVAAPVGGSIAAIDGDTNTSWIADPQDLRPTLTLAWIGRRSLSGIDLDVNHSAAASPADVVTLVFPGGQRVVELDSAGRGSFAPFRADTVDIRLSTTAAGKNLEYDGTGSDLPVGISDVELAGLDLLPLRLSPDDRSLGCGSGPALAVNGERVATEIVGSALDLFEGNHVAAEVCSDDPVQLRVGQNDVTVEASAEFRAESLRLFDVVAPPAGTVSPVQLTTYSPVRRSVSLPSSSDANLLLVRENQNAGWEAARGGRKLVPVTVDGWQQGWILPNNVHGDASLRYAPDRVYRYGLGAGAISLLLLLLLACLPHRRLGLEDSETLQTRQINRPTAAVLAIGLMGVLAGWSGAVLTVLAIAGWMCVPRSRPKPGAEWVLVLPLTVAALVYAANPWGDPDGWAGNLFLPQFCVALALSMLAGLVFVGPRKASLRLRKGFSTKR